MDHGQVAANAEGRQRLQALVERLSDEQLARPLEAGWTAAALLAHLAFWDRFVGARWLAAAQAGQRVPAGIADGVAQLINEALMDEWRALAPRTAAALALAAAEAVEQLVAGLPDDVVAEAQALGRGRLVDRSVHWNEHLSQIEEALR
jgi:hypothetical protein